MKRAAGCREGFDCLRDEVRVMQAGFKRLRVLRFDAAADLLWRDIRAVCCVVQQ